MRLLRPLQRLYAALRPRGRGEDGPVTITYLPGPNDTPTRTGYPVRPGMPALPPGWAGRPDPCEQHTHNRVRRNLGEE